MTDIPDFKEYLGRPVKEVVDELSKKLPDYDVAEFRTDWFTTTDYCLDRIRVYFHPGSDVVSDVVIG